jgi:hypothetical protein
VRVGDSFDVDSDFSMLGSWDLPPASAAVQLKVYLDLECTAARVENGISCSNGDDEVVSKER